MARGIIHCLQTLVKVRCHFETLTVFSFRTLNRLFEQELAFTVANQSLEASYLF